MLEPNGNMADVYRQAHRLFDVAERVEREVNAAPALRQTEEIAEGDRADWYVIRTKPGEDMRALRWLARRWFGVFRPMQQRVRDGVRYDAMEPVYPGMLLVFTWNIDRARPRIMRCPGVLGILCNAEGRPVGVDMPDQDGKRFVEKLREISYRFDVVHSYAQRQGARNRRRKPRPGRRLRKAAPSTAMSG
jgi:hypothetical protein